MQTLYATVYKNCITYIIRSIILIVFASDIDSIDVIVIHKDIINYILMLLQFHYSVTVMIIIMGEMAIVYMAGYLIERRCKWPII